MKIRLPECSFVGIVLGIAFLSFAGAACSAGSHSKEEQAAEFDINKFLPPAWTLEDSLEAKDRKYLATITSFERSGFAKPVPPYRVLSVYRRDGAAVTEVVRLVDDGFTSNGAPVGIKDRANALTANPDGNRSITVTRGENDWETMSFDASGSVTLGDPSRGSTVAYSPRPRPLTSIAVPNGPFSAPKAFEIPAGALPASWTPVHAIWSPDRRYLATVTRPHGEYVLTLELSIYEVGNESLKELWRGIDGGVFASVDETTAFRDWNGDGRPEVLFEIASGGNCWACNPRYAVTQLPDGSFGPLRIKEGRGVPQGKPIDIDKDGRYELVGIDASWEYRGFTHAGSPGSTLIWAWNGQEYAWDPSPKYKTYIEDIRRNSHGYPTTATDPITLDPVPPPVSASCLEKNTFLSDSVSRYLDYVNTGRQVEADRIVAALRSYPFGAISWKRDWVLDQLKNLDDSSGFGSEFFNPC